jgi:hypothetical protein
MPFNADESMGTPITGSVVCAATTPPRCAAAPAPTMNNRTPRSGASSTSRITRAGERCALATVISLEMPNSFKTSTAACITGASESDPIRINTCGILECLRVYRRSGGQEDDLLASLSPLTPYLAVRALRPMSRRYCIPSNDISDTAS